MAENDGTVIYTTKELLARLDGKLDQVIGKLDQKVDNRSFELLTGRVQAVEGALTDLRARGLNNRLWITAIVALLGAVVGALAIHLLG